MSEIESGVTPLKKTLLKLSIVIVLILGFVLFKHYELGSLLTLNSIVENQQRLKAFYEGSTATAITLYFIIYIAMAALSLPGAAVLTLLGGALFGLSIGVLIVSFASTIGATLAFLSSRYLLRESIERRFKKMSEAINSGVEREGAFYLFTLRVVPLFPFFVINLVMGLTKMSVAKFFIVSQLGMFPGTIIYVNAGKQLGEVDSLGSILSADTLIALGLLGVFPLLTKKGLDWYKRRQVYAKFKRPKQYQYNMVVIGAGSAGLVTAYICAAVKAKVALIEKHKMGGDCLNTGCVPSKAIIRSAKLAHQMREANRYGLEPHQPKIDFQQVMGRVQRVITEIEPHDSIERYTQLGVECYQGAAKILSPWEVEVNGEVLSTKNITIATGASPWIPPIPGLEEITPLTSENLWSLTKLPSRLVVLGGGPIGCEMAQSFQRLGSQVTLVEMSERLMTMEDPEVGAFIAEEFRREGVEVLTSHKAIKVMPEKSLVVLGPDGERELPFDEVLVAVGRKANTGGFGAEELGIKLRANQTFEANAFLQTNYPNIYVCGDVTGPYQLTHTASHQAWFCSVNALFGHFKKFKVDYRVIPWATYTDPEVASVGLNEQRAREQGIPYDLTTYGLDDLDRAIADSDNKGFVRVLTRPGSDKILGATIVGAHAADVLVEFIAAMKHGFGLNKILGTIHIYPTMGEASKFVAGNWKRQQVGQKTLKWLERFHGWSRS